MTYISPDFWYFPLKNRVLKLFIRCFSPHPVSILTFTGFVKLFQAALKSRSMDLAYWAEIMLPLLRIERQLKDFLESI